MIVTGDSATNYAVVCGSATVSKPNLTVAIKLGKGSTPANNVNAYDAREVMTNLESKIQRPGK